MLVESSIDYDGFFTRPLNWEEVIRKFDALTSDRIDEESRLQMQKTIADLENHDVPDLTIFLEKAREREN